MADVRLEHVWKQFDDDTVAVRDVSFGLKDGSFLVIVGPSGCGKTTTLRMIAGLETVTEGQVYIDGNVVNDVHPKDRDIAMVFQNYALYPHMTVRQNLEFALKMRKVGKQAREQQVVDTARMLELSQLLDRKPKQLSGGQRQRVALGRAIVRQPKVFLFDEPLSNLDAKLRTQTRAELQRLHHELKATSIYVTHDQVEAMTMADKIVVMNNGEIQQVDAPMTLYNRPTNRFVAGFIGSIGMNFFEGRLERSGNAVRFAESVENGTELPIPDSVPDHLQNAVTLGVRPEHFAVTDASDPSGFDVTVEVVETLGSHTLVHFKSGAGLSVASVDPDSRPAFGDRLRLRVQSGKAHFFDKEGNSIREQEQSSVAA